MGSSSPSQRQRALMHAAMGPMEFNLPVDELRVGISLSSSQRRAVVLSEPGAHRMIGSINSSGSRPRPIVFHLSEQRQISPRKTRTIHLRITGLSLLSPHPALYRAYLRTFQRPGSVPILYCSAATS